MTEIVNSRPELYDDATDVGRFNTLLDAVTEKRFASPVIFAQAVRGACDLHGIVLPLLDIEGGNGATVDDGKFILARITDPTNPNMYAPPTECEHVFHVEDIDGNITDLYLYIAVDRDDEGYYECYAQLVHEEELHHLLNVDERDYPEVENLTFLDMVRHARGDIITDVDDTPPDM